MNGSLIFAVIHIIKALECMQLENMNSTNNNNDTNIIEKQLSQQNGTEEENINTELSGLMRLLKKQCSCPCSGVPHAPLCGKTTNGLTKTFDSQCHLICHNQCDLTDERYALFFYGECPMLPVTSPLLNRKNVYSAAASTENRRIDIGPNAYTPIIVPLDVHCDCSYCPNTRWIRLDYYPICGERAGQKVTFDSWCHFDCENKCVRQTGYTYIYLHKGPCELEQEDEIVIPRTVKVTGAKPCDSCNLRCKDFYEPVCTKNFKNEFLSFKSRCHMRCHNQCHHPNDLNENFIHIFDGQCPWA